MYPDIPNNDITWNLTQHAGVIDKNVVRILLEACAHYSGQCVDNITINNNITSQNVLSQNLRKDSNRMDVWRDYQQILSELGLIYSTRVSREILLTPIAVAFLDGEISYEELITLQLLKYQYPNGHKTQMGPHVKHGYAEAIGAASYTEVQASYGMLVRPAVLIFTIMNLLLDAGELPELSVDEMQTYVVRCLKNTDAPFCVQYIINARRGTIALSPLPRARRNMQDWIKILIQTPLFTSSDFRILKLSNYAIEHIEGLQSICNTLSAPESFWIFDGSSNYKFDWFSFYGNINLGFDWIPTDKTEFEKSQDSTSTPTQEPSEKDSLITPSIIKLQTYNGRTSSQEISSTRQVISKYNYNKSKKGYFLHDSMVDFIARRCKSKGAEVYEDRSSIDLFIKHHNREYLVEVKSITPSNFIQRLRTAIGQVNQYDFLYNKLNERRLGLAFTACIPKESWVIPFITSHLNMDLLTMDNDDLVINSNNSHSIALYSA